MSNLKNIILGLFFAVCGVFVIADREIFLSVLFVCAGIGSVAGGANTLRSIRIWRIEGTSATLAKIKGAGLIVFGVLAVVSPFSTASFFAAVFIYIFATALLFSSFVSVQNAVIIRRLSEATDIRFLLIEAAVELAVAVIMFLNPEKIIGIAVVSTGLVLLAAGVVLVVVQLIRIKKGKQGITDNPVTE